MGRYHVRRQPYFRSPRGGMESTERRVFCSLAVDRWADGRKTPFPRVFYGGSFLLSFCLSHFSVFVVVCSLDFFITICETYEYIGTP